MVCVRHTQFRPTDHFLLVVNAKVSQVLRSDTQKRCAIIIPQWLAELRGREKEDKKSNRRSALMQRNLTDEVH